MVYSEIIISDCAAFRKILQFSHEIWCWSRNSCSGVSDRHCFWALTVVLMYNEESFLIALSCEWKLSRWQCICECTLPKHCCFAADTNISYWHFIIVIVNYYNLDFAVTIPFSRLAGETDAEFKAWDSEMQRNVLTALVFSPFYLCEEM